MTTKAASKPKVQSKAASKPKVQSKAASISKPQVKEIFKTADSFVNFAAKLGVNVKGAEGSEDNLLSSGGYEFNLVTRNRILLEAAYRGSWIVGRVIDAKAKDMVRAGIILTCGEDADLIDDFQLDLKRKKIWSALCSTIKWGDLYGGSLAVMQIKGQKLESPLEIEKVSQGDFVGLDVYDRWQLQPDLVNLIEEGPDKGLPKYYSIVTNTNPNQPTDTQTGQIKVHHSRCARAIGHELPYFQAVIEMLWGESVLERLWDRLIAFDTATLSCGNLITRANLRTVQIPGLRDIIGAGGDAMKGLLEMIEMMRQLQSNEGMTLLDGEDIFASVAYTFAGLSDMMVQFAQQVSGAAETPLVVLFGQSPAGLNATGESDLRLYYDGINAKQEANLRNPLETIIKVAWQSMTGKPAPKDLAFVFTPLWQVSAVEKATIASQNTTTIIAAHDAGGIDIQTMMKELKQASGDTGLFTHITDEQIEDAENDEPPAPALPAKKESAEPEEKPESKAPPTGDSAWNRIKKFAFGDRGVAATIKEGKDSKPVISNAKIIRDWLDKTDDEEKKPIDYLLGEMVGPKKNKAKDAKGGWITEHGAHVYVNEKGEITKGPKGEKLSHAESKKSSTKKKESSSPKKEPAKNESSGKKEPAAAPGSPEYLGPSKRAALEEMNYKQTENGPTPHEALAVNSYTRKSFREFIELDKSGQADPENDRLNTFLAKTKKYDGDIYRGLAIPHDKLDAFLDQFAEGQEIKLPAKSSFTKEPSFANQRIEQAAFEGDIENKSAHIILKVPNSKSGVDVSSWASNPKEQEVLVPKGTKYKVKSMERDGDKYVITLEDSSSASKDAGLSENRKRILEFIK